MGRQVDEHVCEPWDESAAMPVNYRMLQLPRIMASCPFENLPHGTSHGNHISKESWNVVHADVPRGQTAPLLSYSEFSLLWSIIIGHPHPNLCDL